MKGTVLETAQADTIRLRLLKIGTIVRVAVRKVWFALSEAYPWRDVFAQVYQQLTEWRRPVDHVISMHRSFAIAAVALACLNAVPAGAIARDDGAAESLGRIAALNRANQNAIRTWTGTGFPTLEPGSLSRCVGASRRPPSCRKKRNRSRYQPQARASAAELWGSSPSTSRYSG